MPPLEVKTRILAGGRIELQIPELPEGCEATIKITVEESPSPPKRRFLDVIGDYKGGQLFRTVEEVDQYIREERDSWER